MDARNVRRIGSQNGRCEMVAKRRLDGLRGLVGPGLDGDGLAPALDAILIGQPHHDGRAERALEELEFPDQRIVHPADVDANNRAHLRPDPLAAPALRPSARLPS